LKSERKGREDLKGQHILLLFEKPSLRTRLSFELAIRELSGQSYYLGQQEVGLDKREALKDIAKVISRYVQCCIVRTFEHQNLLEFAKHSSIPVINALTDLEHPCQIISDLMTIEEKIGNLNNFKLAFIGDGNNVCHSLIQSASILGYQLSIATPEGYEPRQEILELAEKRAKASGARIELFHEPEPALRNADFIYTDVWTSMGWEEEKEKRKKIFADFQINSELLKSMKKNFYIMHCLPAHRGEEITDEVIDSPNSIVWEQAENRLHMQKALLIKLLSRE
jgi:ornithine carbamoyltransferase